MNKNSNRDFLFYISFLLFYLKYWNENTKYVTLLLKIKKGRIFMALLFKNLFKKEKIQRYKIKEYPETPTQYSVEPDGSIPMYFGEELLKNPDRGFRGELYITLGDNLRAYPQNNENPYERLEREMEAYKDDGVSIYQLYVYLFDFYNREIPRYALDQLTAYLEQLKKYGLRVLMRFAYEYDDSIRKGPKTKQIVEHTKQLKKWFDENEQLVNDTVYCMQLGLIGLWGEGHTSRYRHDEKTVVQAAFDMIPDGMTMMVRNPTLMSAVSDENESKISLHDDFLVGIEHVWGMIPFDHPDNDTLLRKCKFSITDGEMPWGRDNTVKVIDPVLLVRQCVSYALRTLSAEHNYKEENNLYHLERWKDVYLTEEQLAENHFPFFPASLEDGKISVYNYLKYHVGYILCASNLKNDGKAVEFDIINYGMSAPIDFEIDIKSGDKITTLNADMTSLRQFSSLHVSTESVDAPLAVRIRHVRAPHLTVKLANNVEYADGWNILIK